MRGRAVPRFLVNASLKKFYMDGEERMDAATPTNSGIDREYSNCYRLYAGPLKRYVTGLVRDEFIAEELVQETFMKLFERGIRLDESRPTLRSFLYMVARHRALDHLARRKREDKATASVAFEEATMNERFFENLENAIIEGEVISTLYDTLQSIPVKKREIFMRRALLDMKIGRVMKDMDVSTFTIKKIEKEVRLRIRDSLGQYFTKG
jgi:RNA polymerase sigma-70 factor, ECF subfamily